MQNPAKLITNKLPKVQFAYIHCKPDGTPFYVGKGTLKRSKNFKVGRNSHYTNVLNKHKPENILVGKLECSSEQSAFDLEKGLIKCLRNMGVELTNMTDGGEGLSGYVHTNDAKSKIGSSSKARGVSELCKLKSIESRKGKPLSNAWCKNLSIARRKRVITDETKDRLSEACKGRIVSKQTRIKISDAQKGVKRPQMSGPKNPMKDPLVAGKVSQAKKGGVWITDGKQIKFIAKSFVLPVGWRFGRK